MRNLRERAEAVKTENAELRKGRGIACTNHDLHHGIACAICLEAAERELDSLKSIVDAATEIQGDAEVLKYVTSGNAVPVTRCTVSADLIRQLVAGRQELAAAKAKLAEIEKAAELPKAEAISDGLELYFRAEDYEELHTKAMHLASENARLRESIVWALGAGDEFRIRQAHEGPFWWRNELSERAGLAWDGGQYVDAARKGKA